MRDSHDGRRHGEMTDTQLDQLLAAANRELLEHIEATTDLSHVLTVIMTRSTQKAHPSETTAPVGHEPGQTLAAEVISLRIRIRDLARDLDRARDLVSDRDLARDLARALARARARALDLTTALALALARDLASALALARDLDRDLDLASDRALDLDLASDRALARELALDLALARAFDLTSALARDLDARQVDASGADLSDTEIRHLDPLNGIIWTPETIWPPGVAAQVEAHSDEIRPGVYQVRLGDTRDRDPLTLI